MGKIDQNKCAEFYEDTNRVLDLSELFVMQESLQSLLGLDIKNLTAIQRLKWLKEYILAMSAEQMELLEMLPWKHWRNYDNDQLNSFINREVLYEWVDCLFFLLNQGLVLGISAKLASNLYLTKYKENINRIKRKYNKNDMGKQDF